MKQKTADAMRPIVELYAQYRGSKKAFCREHGLAEHVLDYWRRKFCEDQEISSSFVALELRDMPTVRGIELHYPNGVKAIFPLETPLELIQHLIRTACLCSH